MHPGFYTTQERNSPDFPTRNVPGAKILPAGKIWLEPCLCQSHSVRKSFASARSKVSFSRRTVRSPLSHFFFGCRVNLWYNEWILPSWLQRVFTWRETCSCHSARGPGSNLISQSGEGSDLSKNTQLVGDRVWILAIISKQLSICIIKTATMSQCPNTFSLHCHLQHGNQTPVYLSSCAQKVNS